MKFSHNPLNLIFNTSTKFYKSPTGTDIQVRNGQTDKMTDTERHTQTEKKQIKFGRPSNLYIFDG